MEKELEQTQSQLIKIALFGPESTGKTTLTQALANHYHTQWVPEFMRIFLQNKWDKHQTTCTKADMLPIAKGQIALENEKAAMANKLLFCDTNLLQNWVYANAYFDDYSNPLLEKYVNKHHYDLYILCNIDVPWEADDLRDKPQEREYMFLVFKNELETRQLPYIQVEGNVDQRLKQCVAHIEQLKTRKTYVETN